MTAKVRAEPTHVPIDRGQDVEVRPGQPWPSAYRGSKYSLVNSRKRNREKILRWEYYDLNVVLEAPAGLESAARNAGKSDGTGKGSFRITASGEVLTKVNADDYPNLEQAPRSSGWIPVYLGKLMGDLGFDGIKNDPDSLGDDEIGIWEGLPFSHGETWAVGVDGKLIWKWEDFRFYSAFDHSDLVEKFKRFRHTGRLYINEEGHVFMNVDSDQLSEEPGETVGRVYDKWRQEAQEKNKTAPLRLVDRRLQSTSQSDNPAEGLLPVYIGHLSDFDDAIVPKPVVDDPTYFAVCGRSETSQW